MNKHPLIEFLGRHPEYRRLREALMKNEGAAAVFGLGEAHRAHMAAALFCDTGKTVLVVTANEASAMRIREEAAVYAPAAIHLPARDMPLAGRGFTASAGLAARRVKALSGLLRGENMLVTVSAAALLQRLTPPGALRTMTTEIRAGEAVKPQTLLKRLVDAGYERVEVCEAKGQVCLRGGYLDVFPITAENPVRIEFFDDEIDTMRTYDALSQRSIENVEAVTVPPAGEMPLTEAARARALRAFKKKPRLSEELAVLSAGGTPAGAELFMPLFYDDASLQDYLSEDAILLIDEPQRVEESAKVAHMEHLDTVSALLADGNAEPEQAELLGRPSVLLAQLDTPRTATLFALTRTYGLIAPKCLFRFETRPATKYLAAQDILASDVASWRKAGTTAVIYAGSHSVRLQDQLLDMDVHAAVTDALTRPLVPGEVIITGESIEKGFEYPEIKLVAVSEAELYGAVQKRTAAAHKKRPQLAFSELSVGDLVVHELHGVGRFVGVITLTVGGVTRDYLHLAYAGGEKLYIPTDQLDRVQKYIGGEEETPDQLTCIAEIKKDMESSRVMDRLLCGDVGYGKTEVALRAAFKAVMDSKQVAFLVPTTILAQQHYNTLAARFAGFPVNVALLSRFKAGKDEKTILEGLAKGSIDVVVGTHKLLGKSVRFKDLGLLIIDEEQRFGVGHKEQIKNIKQSVDVLTLSATPIPRTLHMSMTGIRDMSVIETPPEQRYPVQTYVMEYSDGMAREAILKEIGRGGQVYFVYNRVRNMERFAEQLRALVPEARIGYAHGQMPEQQLEQTMLDFMEQRYDVLLCSTIIESGLDIPNVNTILVYEADRMGLSQLYQLRGRVGRGARLGYAYLTFMRDKVLTEVAEKRLSAIREFTQFGAGFKIAMRDLEIRGAGNLLGPEQHGHMAAVGYDLYCKIVNSAVKEARGEAEPRAIETVMDVPLSAAIPHPYIPRETERLSMYKRIALIASREDLYDVQDELIDRYGEIPPETKNLLDIALIKAEASHAHIAQLSVRDGEVRFTFDKDAPMNGQKLLKAIGEIPGAQFLNGEVPALSVRMPRADAEKLCGMLPQFVYTLADCIEAN